MGPVSSKLPFPQDDRTSYFGESVAQLAIWLQAFERQPPWALGRLLQGPFVCLQAVCSFLLLINAHILSEWPILRQSN